FTSDAELRQAMKEYLDPDTRDAAVSTYGPIESWGVSAVEDFSLLFQKAPYTALPGASTFNDDISGWDVSSGTNFNAMFLWTSSFNQDISGWDVSSGIDFEGMFNQASSFNQDISGWDTSSGTKFRRMFYSTQSFNQELCSCGSHFSSSKVYTDMFEGSSCPIKSQPTGASGPWCRQCVGRLGFTSDAELRQAMKEYLDPDTRDAAVSTYGPIESWGVSAVEDFSRLFVVGGSYTALPGASTFNDDISGWDVSSGTNFNAMFLWTSSFNQDISGWDVSSGIDFEGMFNQASSFNQDISGWDTSSGTKFRRMFYSTQSFNQELCSWGSHYSSSKVYTDMFDDSSCLIKLSPNNALGPWCQLCTPTNTPTTSPTSSPSLGPSMAPSTSPSLSPSKVPSTSPSLSPSEVLSTSPSLSPSEVPSAIPSLSPSANDDYAIDIKGLSFNITTPSMVGVVNVYHRPGSHGGYERESQYWTLVYGNSSVLASDGAVSVELSTSVFMEISSKHSFFVYTTFGVDETDATRDMSPEGSVYRTTDDLDYHMGKTFNAEFGGGCLFTPRAWNGDLLFTREFLSTEPSGYPSTQPSVEPSAKPSLSPSVLPTSEPSDMPSYSFQPSLSPSISSRPTLAPTKYGRGVDISGDTIIVGDGINPSCGGASIYKRINGVWTVQSQLAPPVCSYEEGVTERPIGFGFSVAVDGDSAIIGSPMDEENGFNSGAAYVYRKSNGTSWDLETKLLASDGAPFDEFGWSVDIKGDFAIAGAFVADIASYVAVRKIKVKLNNGESVLNLGEIQAFDVNGVNVALGKPVTQSSTYGNFVASNVVDGDPNTISHTKLQHGAWLEVDLQSEVDLTEVVITNRLSPSVPEKRAYRYVKLSIIYNGGALRTCVDEFEIFDGTTLHLPISASVDMATESRHGTVRTYDRLVGGQDRWGYPTHMCPAHNGTTSWNLIYDMGAMVGITKYAITPEPDISDHSYSPRDWKMYGSNDRNSWWLLDSVENYTSWEIQERSYFDVAPLNVQKRLSSSTLTLWSGNNRQVKQYDIGDTSSTTKLSYSLGDREMTGHAYIYGRSGTEWEQASKIDSPADSDDFFGHSVSIGHKVAVLGTFGYSFIYLQSPDGTWNQRDKLSNANGDFWTDVTVHGNSILKAGGGSALITDYPSLFETSSETERDTFLNREWELISRGTVPWNNSSIGQWAVAGSKITSKFSQGDEKHTFSEIDLFDSNWEWYTEYKVTWQPSNSSAASIQVKQVELPGLLGQERPVATISNAHKGKWLANILQFSNDISVHNGNAVGGDAFSVAKSGSRIFDGNTKRFKMHLSGDGVPALSFRPNSGRYSIATGIRVYTANNDPDSDPLFYVVEGRDKPGVKIKNVGSNSCWYITDNSTIDMGDCDSSESEYLFYTNNWGEIRSSAPNHIGRCVDPSDHVLGLLKFKTCNSYEHGENHAQAQNQYFAFDGDLPNGIFSIVTAKTGLCMNQLVGHNITLETCNSNITSQQYYFKSEGRHNVDDANGWNEVSSGKLPWVSPEARNGIGQAISSKFNEGDDNLHFTEAKFYSSATPYYEYKISFPKLRSETATSLHFAEIELPGTLIFSHMDDGAAVSHNLTRQECAQACVDQGSLCHGIGYSAMNGNVYLANDCILYSSVVGNGCNNRHYQLELFSISDSKHPEDDPYVRLPMQSLATTTSFNFGRECVSGDKLAVYFNVTRKECRQLCVDHGSNCFGVEYHTSATRNAECAITNSTNTNGCDNTVLDIEILFQGRAPTIVPVPTVSPSTSPITESPTASFELHLLDNLEMTDAAPYDRLGVDIGIDIVNNFIITGSPYADTYGFIDSGAANIYTLDEDGTSWSHLIRLQANDLDENALFGTAVAVSEPYAVVGNHKSGNGAAYVFGRIGEDGPWVQQAKLEDSSGSGSDQFGVDVDIFNNTIIVGSDHYNSTGSKCGAVFIYKRKYFSWLKYQTIEPTNCTSESFFGRSVHFEAGTDSRFIVGSNGDSSVNGAHSGSAYIYSYNENTTLWELEAKLFAHDGQPGDSFGISTAISSGRAIVGAYLDDTDFGGFDVGSAYIFQKVNSTSWVQETKLVNSDGMSGDGFGSRVAIYRDVVVVGAPEDDISDVGQDTRGSAYIFAENKETHEWDELKKVSGAHTNVTLGTSVAIHEKTVFIGAPRETINNVNESGHVLIYEMSGPTIFQPTSAPSKNPTSHPSSSPISVSNSSLVLADGSVYNKCPGGTEVSQSNCLEALITVTADLDYNLFNSDVLSVDDWVGLPCGCFLYNNTFLNFDTNCQNAGTNADSQLVCLTDEVLDGVCSRYESTGYHSGDIVMTLLSNVAPNGIQWAWQECAQVCLQYSNCLRDGRKGRSTPAPVDGTAAGASENTRQIEADLLGAGHPRGYPSPDMLRGTHADIQALSTKYSTNRLAKRGNPGGVQYEPMEGTAMRLRTQDMLQGGS
ncbi:hypothetical protein THAOC_32683, partial [Thalassiosira oceanica]